MSDKQIAYILSTNYAGSHFLGLQLGSHSQCASIGELHHFRRGLQKRPRACFRCELDSECPVLKGLDDVSISRYYSKIFENLADFDEKITTVIDNSKKVRWACRFVDMPGYTKKYIHLIRDPRALVRRWTISFDESTKKKMRIKTARRCWPHAWDILTGDEANVYVWDWLYENRQISKFIQSNKLDAQIVTYHDLVFKTDPVLSELMAWLGYDYQPSQKEYWNFIHHGSGKRTIAHTEKKIYSGTDQRWKTFLDSQTQQRAYSHRSANKYLDSIDLVYDIEAGLSKESAMTHTS